MKRNLLTIVFAMLCAVSYSQNAYEYLKLLNTEYMGTDKRSFYDLSDYGVFEDGRTIDTIKAVYHHRVYDLKTHQYTDDYEDSRIYNYTLYRQGDSSFVTEYYNDKYEYKRAREKYITKKLLPDGDVELHIWSTAYGKHYIYRFNKQGRVSLMCEIERTIYFDDDLIFIPYLEYPAQPFDVTKDKQGRVVSFDYNGHFPTIKYNKKGLVESTYGTDMIGNTFFLFDTEYPLSILYEYSDYTDKGSWRRCDLYFLKKGKKGEKFAYITREIITH